MTLNKKLTLGLGFLFIIIFTMEIFCSYYIQKLSRESENILRDNYNSIVYSKKMAIALDDMAMSVTFRLFNPHKGDNESGYYTHLFTSGKTEFEKNLKAEKSNITEMHEKDYAETLNMNYIVFVKLCAQIGRGRGGSEVYFSEFLPVYEKLKQTINSINDINMQAVVRKNQLAKRDSSSIIISMAIIGSICMILAFGYIWYFPFFISNSMSYLSNKMKDLLATLGIPYEIKTNDELHVILQSLNLIETRFTVKKNEVAKTKPIRKKGR
jgi:two-component system, NtrC family, sensor histidine kinase KinB